MQFDIKQIFIICYQINLEITLNKNFKSLASGQLTTSQKFTFLIPLEKCYLLKIASDIHLVFF